MDCVMIVRGDASGELLVATEPLSFWGGYDAQTGEIIDRRHPLQGQNAAAKVLAVPGTRGSSTTAQVLLEAIRAGTSPAAIVTTEPDTFIALAAIVAEEMYGKVMPIVVVNETDFTMLETGKWIQISDNALTLSHRER